jgi:hypothetical protein
MDKLYFHPPEGLVPQDIRQLFSLFTNVVLMEEGKERDKQLLSVIYDIRYSDQYKENHENFACCFRRDLESVCRYWEEIWRYEAAIPVLDMVFNSHNNHFSNMLKRRRQIEVLDSRTQSAGRKREDDDLWNRFKKAAMRDCGKSSEPHAVELHLNVMLESSIDNDVISILRYMIADTECEPDLLPAADLFKGESWKTFLLDDLNYSVKSSMLQLVREQDETCRLCIKTSFVDEDKIFLQEFLSWLIPYCRAGKGDCGSYHYHNQSSSIFT